MRMVIYLLLTEFEVRTLSYGSSFCPLIYVPSAQQINGENRAFVTYGMDRENEFSKIFIIYEINVMVYFQHGE